jgi:fructokinase
MKMRIGIDLGGTKTEIMAMSPGDVELWRRRVPTPHNFDGTIGAITELIKTCEAHLKAYGSVGLAIPGCETADGTIKNANSTWLNGRPLRAALEKALKRDVRLANDANCFALSEAQDGAGAGAHGVFGVIAGTGLGGGIVIDRKVLTGAHGIAGEWGHMPLPWPTPEEMHDAPSCYCGKRGCMETWCSGTALTRLFSSDPLRPSLPRESATATSPAETGEGPVWTAEMIANSSDPRAVAAMDRLVDRLARGLAVVCNIVDPDVIVLGGGLSHVDRLYTDLAPSIKRYAFTLGAPPRIVKNVHGDSSGVRGAARLWPESQI